MDGRNWNSYTFPNMGQNGYKFYHTDNKRAEEMYIDTNILNTFANLDDPLRRNLGEKFEMDKSQDDNTKETDYTKPKLPGANITIDFHIITGVVKFFTSMYNNITNVFHTDVNTLDECEASICPDINNTQPGRDLNLVQNNMKSEKCKEIHLQSPNTTSNSIYQIEQTLLNEISNDSIDNFTTIGKINRNQIDDDSLFLDSISYNVMPEDDMYRTHSTDSNKEITPPLNSRSEHKHTNTSLIDSNILSIARSMPKNSTNGELNITNVKHNDSVMVNCVSLNNADDRKTMINQAAHTSDSDKYNVNVSSNELNNNVMEVRDGVKSMCPLNEYVVETSVDAHTEVKTPHDTATTILIDNDENNGHCDMRVSDTISHLSLHVDMNESSLNSETSVDSDINDNTILSKVNDIVLCYNSPHENVSDNTCLPSTCNESLVKNLNEPCNSNVQIKELGCNSRYDHDMSINNSSVVNNILNESVKLGETVTESSLRCDNPIDVVSNIEDKMSRLKNMLKKTKISQLNSQPSCIVTDICADMNGSKHSKHVNETCMNNMLNVKEQTESITDDMSFGSIVDSNTISEQGSPIIKVTPAADDVFNEIKGRFHQSSESDDSFVIVFSDKIPETKRQRVPSDCASEDSFIISFEEEDNQKCFTSSDVFDSDYSDTESSDYDSDARMNINPFISRTVPDLTDERLYLDDCESEKMNQTSISEDEVDCSTRVNDESKSESSGIVKKVRFAEKPVVHVMRVWSYAARKARAGPWERLALDRERFKRRILDVEMAISWVLKPQHRNRIKFQRFMPWWNAQRRQELAEKKEREAVERLKLEIEDASAANQDQIESCISETLNSIDESTNCDNSDSIDKPEVVDDTLESSQTINQKPNTSECTNNTPTDTTHGNVTCIKTKFINGIPCSTTDIVNTKLDYKSCPKPTFVNSFERSASSKYSNDVKVSKPTFEFPNRMNLKFVPRLASSRIKSKSIKERPSTKFIKSKDVKTSKVTNKLINQEVPRKTPHIQNAKHHSKSLNDKPKVLKSILKNTNKKYVNRTGEPKSSDSDCSCNDGDTCNNDSIRNIPSVNDNCNIINERD